MAERYSIAEARHDLARIVHRAEDGRPIELTRRGKTVAVLVGKEDYDRLVRRRDAFKNALDRFRERYDLEALDLAAAFDGIREPSPGRDVEL